MNNLHISLTNVKNESRLFKETNSLVSHNIVDKVFIVGLWEEGLALEEDIDVKRVINRLALKSRKWPKNLISQIFKYIEFSFVILWKYRKKNIRLITIHSLGLLPLGVLCKVVYGANLIYDAHEYETERQGLSGIRKRLSKILEKKLIVYCNKVIVVSEPIADEYKKMYPDLLRPYVVLNTPLYKNIEKKDIFRETFDIAKDKIIFLYQGGLSSGRGIEILLNTFKDIKDEKSVIAFMGYGLLQKDIEKASKEYVNIYFHPAVSPDVLLDYTSSADFGISTIEDTCLSYHYCLPNKMFEYTMAEIPVIVSNLPEMKRIVEDNAIGIVSKKNNPDGLREAIQKATRLDKEELQKNIQKVKKVYNWEEQEKVLLEVYKGFI